MPRTTHHLVLVSALALVLAPAVAQARFGKSDDHNKSDDNKQSDSHSSNSNDSNDQVTTSNGGSHYHEATPVGVPSSDRPVMVSGSGCSSDGCCWRHGRGWPAYFYEPSPGYVGYAGYNAGQVQTSQDTGFRIRTELTGDLMPFSTMDGGSVVAQLRIEGTHWGMSVDGRHIAVGADDGSGGVDGLSFFNGFITYALLGNERGRLRLEAGANTAFAPDLIVMSPAVGASFALGFGENLGLEGVARISLIPHTQVELAAGLSYSLGPLGLRVGVRQLYLNDNGLVDGVAHEDTFTGPYVGVGMAF